MLKARTPIQRMVLCFSHWQCSVLQIKHLTMWQNVRDNCRYSISLLAYTIICDLRRGGSLKSHRYLCHCCRNAVPVERDTCSSGGAEQRVCLGRTVQQVQPRDAEQLGVRWPRWLPGTNLPTGWYCLGLIT